MKYTLEAGGFNDSGDAGDWKEVSKSKPAVLSVIGNLTGTEKDDPKKEEFSARAKMSGVFIPEDSEAGATTEDFLSATDDLSMLIMVPLTDYMSESLRKMGYGNIQLPYSQAPPMDNDNQDSV